MKLPNVSTGTHLFIFTDASITQLYTGEYVGCSGAVAYSVTNEGATMIDENFVVNRNSTNNNSEILAIYLGIQLALKWRFHGQFDSINLFSDSKISIYGLREWIANWVKKSNGDELIGSTNTPVSNQQEILNCIYTIIANNLDIKLFHQKGHIERSGLMKALEVFKNTNHIEEFITNDFMNFICDCNNYVDNKSRDILTSTINQAGYLESTNIDKDRVPLFTLKYSPFNIDYYLSLVSN